MLLRLFYIHHERTICNVHLHKFKSGLTSNNSLSLDIRVYRLNIYGTTFQVIFTVKIKRNNLDFDSTFLLS